MVRFYLYCKQHTTALAVFATFNKKSLEIHLISFLFNFQILFRENRDYKSATGQLTLEHPFSFYYYFIIYNLQCFIFYITAIANDLGFLYSGDFGLGLLFIHEKMHKYLLQRHSIMTFFYIWYVLLYDVRHFEGE